MCSRRVWDVETGKETRLISVQPSGVLALAWSPDGKTLAGECGQGAVRLWDAITGKPIGQDLKGPGNVHFLAWSSDSRWLAMVVPGGPVRLYDVQTGKEGRVPVGVAGTAHRLAWSPRGALLATCGDDGAVRLWDADSRGQRGILLTVGQVVALSADGHYRGPPEVRNALVYVVQTDAGQETLRPDEFEKKYGWKNDPARVRLTPPRREP